MAALYMMLLVAWKTFAKGPNHKVAKWSKQFLLLVSSDGLKLAWIDVYQDGFLHKTAAFCTEKCMIPLHFHNFKYSQGTCNPPLKNYRLVWDAIIFRASKLWLYTRVTLAVRCCNLPFHSFPDSSWMRHSKNRSLTCFLRKESYFQQGNTSPSVTKKVFNLSRQH